MYDELTKVDIIKMEEEIKYRRSVLAPELGAELKRTREFGDLSENAEYKEAKRAKRKTESRIRYLEAMIRTAYEKTVNNTGKISMPYMNTILTSWHSKGIKTVSQISEKETPVQKGKNNTASYQLDDMAAIERRLRLEKQKK